MNLAVCRALTPAQRAKTFTHPEFGVLNMDWLMAWAAGHERNHLPQIEAVANVMNIALCDLCCRRSRGAMAHRCAMATRLLLAVLWPIGPLAFVVVVAILVAAAPVAFIGPKR